MSVDCGDDGPDVWLERFIRARAEHTCAACCTIITRGELYHQTRSLYDGGWTVVKRCARCQAIFELLSCKVRELPGDQCCDPRLDCGHTYQENFGDTPIAVQALAFMTRNEAQRLAELIRMTRPPNEFYWEEHGPREAPEAWIERLLVRIYQPAAAP